MKNVVLGLMALSINLSFCSLTAFADNPLQTVNHIDENSVREAYLTKKMRSARKYEFDFYNAKSESFNYSFETQELYCLTAPKNKNLKISESTRVESENECKQLGKIKRTKPFLKLLETRQPIGTHFRADIIKPLQGKPGFQKELDYINAIKDCANWQADAYNMAARRSKSFSTVRSSYIDDPFVLYGGGPDIIIFDQYGSVNKDPALGLTFNRGVQVSDKIYIKALFIDGKCYITPSEMIVEAFNNLAKMEEALDQAGASEPSPVKTAKSRSTK